MKTFGYSPSQVVPHGSYLINLGNPDAYVFCINHMSLSTTVLNER